MKGYLTVTLNDFLGVDIKREAGTPELPTMQRVVNGLIETAFRVKSPFRKNISIDGYVNEEGLLMDLPRVLGVVDAYGERAFSGNMIIVGGDERNGKTVSLTEAELDYIVKSFDNGFFVFVE
mgnify:CR=1 FL=1